MEPLGAYLMIAQAQYENPACAGSYNVGPGDDDCITTGQLADLFCAAWGEGMSWVNQYDGGDMTAPFGGFKQSGNGRDKSLHAFDKYTEIKATWIKL